MGVFFDRKNSFYNLLIGHGIISTLKNLKLMVCQNKKIFQVMRLAFKKCMKSRKNVKAKKVGRVVNGIQNRKVNSWSSGIPGQLVS